MTNNNNDNNILNNTSDTTLDNNKKIEEAILALQQAPSDELLAHTLTVIRHRMQEHAHLVVAVDTNPATNAFSLQTLSTSDGKKWFYAFTSYDEQFKGSNAIMSGFTSPIDKLFSLTLETDEVEGLILNPWNRTIMLSKELIRIILGVSQ